MRDRCKRSDLTAGGVIWGETVLRGSPWCFQWCEVAATLGIALTCSNVGRNLCRMFLKAWSRLKKTQQQGLFPEIKTWLIDINTADVKELSENERNKKSASQNLHHPLVAGCRISWKNGNIGCAASQSPASMTVTELPDRRSSGTWRTLTHNRGQFGAFTKVLHIKHVTVLLSYSYCLQIHAESFLFNLPTHESLYDYLLILFLVFSTLKPNCQETVCSNSNDKIKNDGVNSPSTQQSL